MPVHETTGVVLEGMDLGEKDRLITFYCRNEGLLRLAVPGAKDYRKGKAGLLQKFCWNDIKYYQKNKQESLGSINDVTKRRLFSRLREDLSGFSYGSYVLEFYKKAGTGQADPLFFNHLVKTLALLSAAEKKKEFKLIHVIFRLRALIILGFKPEILQCKNCGRKFSASGIKQNERVVLSLSEGAIICCAEADPAGGKFPLDKLTFDMLNYFIKEGFEAIQGEYEYFGEERLDYLHKIIEKFINYHLDLSLNSNRFLSGLN